jgi:hypothetical protein
VTCVIRMTRDTGHLRLLHEQYVALGTDIRYNLSGVVDQRLIGGGRASLEEACRYEHA